MSNLSKPIVNVNSTSIVDGSVVNADVASNAAIAVSKLAALTASRAAVVNSSGVLAPAAATTDTEIGYVNGVTSAIQTQLGTKAPLASPTFTGTVTLPAGTGAGTLTTVGVLYFTTADTATTGTTNQELYGYNIPANTLARDGQAIRIRAWLTTAANSNNKTITMLVGGNTVESMSSLAENNGVFWVEALVIRASSSTMKTLGWITSTSSAQRGLSGFTRSSVDYTGALAISLQATTPTASGDVTARAMIVEVMG